MSWLSDVFGGGSKTSKSTSQSISKPMDARIGVEGGFTGQLIGAGGVSAAGGSIATRVGDFSQMTQTITGNKFRVGMSSTEVADLVKQASSIASENLTKVADFGAKAISAVTQAQTGQGTDLARFIPLIVIGLVALRAVKGRR